MLLDMTDYLQALFTGKWKVLVWMFVGSLIAFTLKLLYSLWIKKLAKDDAAYVLKNQSIPIETFKKKAKFLLITIVLILFVLLPASIWTTVEILKRIESSPDWLNVLIIFVLFLVILVVNTVQTVRYVRLNRRIKLMAKTKRLQETSVIES